MHNAVRTGPPMPLLKYLLADGAQDSIEMALPPPDILELCDACKGDDSGRRE